MAERIRGARALARVDLPASFRWHRLALRTGLMLGFGALAALLLAQRLAQLQAEAVLQALWSAHPLRWGAAVVLTALSFAAAGRYDAVLHRHLGTGVTPARARAAGGAAIAISQMLGLGVISGAIVRWRMLPELSLARASVVTLAVAGSFLAAWAVLTALVLLALPGAPLRVLAGPVLALALGLAVLSALGGPRRLAARGRWPNLFTMSRLLMLGAVDLGAAALSLWLFLPGLPLEALLPAFLLAYGAGLVAATPGGAGAFEAGLLAFLPGLAPDPVIGGVLAWRLVYHALPALIGAGVAALGPRPAPLRAPPADPAAIAGAEARGLALSGPLDALALPGATLAAGRTPHALITLGARGTSRPQARALLAAHLAAARAEDRAALHYKADARLAAAARRAGWTVWRSGAEGWISPADWRPDGPAMAGLRRKLRHAAAAGVTCAAVDTPDWAELAAVNARWCAAHGHERGFSMGRHDPAHLSRQRLFVAQQGGQCLAYVSFHAGPEAWVLDLLRSRPEAPDGTLPALIAAVIAQARSEGAPALSLAAAPRLALPTRAPRRLTRTSPFRDGGLHRFKQAFAPRWRPHYLIAPSPLTLALAGAELARAIHRPGPNCASPHDHPAPNEIAMGLHPWQRGADDRSEPEGAPWTSSPISLPPATG